MGIEAVLFDADGVLQAPRPDRPRMLAEAFGCSDDEVPRWLGDLFAIEDGSLTGEADFAAGIAELLGQRACPGTAQQVLDALAAIEVDAAIFPWIRGLRARGVRCFLATNQERHRGTAMSRDLGFAQLFEAEFYSFAMGVAKPERAFFQRILDATGIPPGQILFVDDRADNVVGARQLGLLAEQVEAGSVVGIVERAIRQSLSPRDRRPAR